MERHLPRPQGRDDGVGLVDLDGDLLAARQQVVIGEGIGVIDDRLLEGASVNGGECGHVSVDFSPQARRCSCGLPGHLEAYASASAVARQAGTLAVEARELTLGNMSPQRKTWPAMSVGEVAAD